MVEKNEFFVSFFKIRWKIELTNIFQYHIIFGVFLLHQMQNRDNGNLLVRKKYSIIDNYLHPDFNPVIVPYIKEKCPRWKQREGSGGYIYLIKVWKQRKLSFPSFYSLGIQALYLWKLNPSLADPHHPEPVLDLPFWEFVNRSHGTSCLHYVRINKKISFWRIFTSNHKHAHNRGFPSFFFPYSDQIWKSVKIIKVKEKSSLIEKKMISESSWFWMKTNYDLKK